MQVHYSRFDEHIRSRLYLYCVLAAIPKMLKRVPSAQAIIERERFSIQFSTRSGLKATLRFNNGDSLFESNSETKADIGLFFLSDTQLNKLFTKRGLSLPVPTRGWAQMHKLKIFKEIADTLQHYLKPTPHMLEKPDFLGAHVSLMLGLAVRSMKQIAEHVPEAVTLLKNCPEGLASFSVGGELESAWISNERAQIDCGFGTPPRKPDVNVWFKNPSLALEALNDKIDVAAEVGLGNIRVEGLVPLADTLGYLMQRIPRYLDM